MRIFTQLRIAVLLRRLARSLERQNELAEQRMRLDYPEWRERPKPRPAEISVPTVAQWNEGFRRKRDEQ